MNKLFLIRSKLVTYKLRLVDCIYFDVLYANHSTKLIDWEVVFSCDHIIEMFISPPLEINCLANVEINPVISYSINVALFLSIHVLLLDPGQFFLLFFHSIIKLILKHVSIILL